MTLRMGQKFKKTPAGEIPVDWESVALHDLGQIITGGTPSTKLAHLWDGQFMFVTPTDMGDSRDVRSTQRHVSAGGLEVAGKIPKMSVMVTCIASIGKMALAAEDCCTNQQINSVVCNQRVIPEFLYYALRQRSRVLKGFAGQTAVPIINKSTFGTFVLPIPPVAEQHKIAQILSSMDDAIEKTKAVIKETAELKKALVQKLFSLGATNHKWTTSTVGDCADINAELLDEKTHPNARFQYIDISSVEGPGLLTAPRQIVFQTAPSRARRVVRAGDILVSTVRPYLRAFAKVEFKIESLIASTGFAVLSARPCVNREFLYQYILSDPFVKYLEERMTGSNYPAVNASDVSLCPIPLPLKAEQDKIADILSSTDAAIVRQTTEKTHLESMKSALMQVLLTGEVRVKYA